MKALASKVSVTLFSMALAAVSLPALAYNGPNQNGPHQDGQHQAHQPPGQQHRPQGGPHAGPPQQVKKVVVIKPHQAWKVGHPMPASYRAKVYRVDYRSHHLKQPGKNQHWYKVNGDYVLVNVISHSILQIITGR